MLVVLGLIGHSGTCSELESVLNRISSQAHNCGGLPSSFNRPLPLASLCLHAWEFPYEITGSILRHRDLPNLSGKHILKTGSDLQCCNADNECVAVGLGRAVGWDCGFRVMPTVVLARTDAETSCGILKDHWGATTMSNLWQMAVGLLSVYRNMAKAIVGFCGDCSPLGSAISSKARVCPYG
jgi:hypothetical protein